MFTLRYYAAIILPLNIMLLLICHAIMLLLSYCGINTGRSRDLSCKV